MALLQPILNIAEILHKKGVNHALISPGSRNAPLTIALARHPGIQTKSVSDERSAAFIALGMSQNLKEPVVICCTSGSAAYNYAPAVAEAFFQEIPLIVLTADRPKEWIHQHDGQTIYQTDIFGKHVKQSFEIGADYSHPDSVWQIERSVNHALNLAMTEPKGPVHINIPLREPFYPLENEEVRFSPLVRDIKRIKPVFQLSKEDWTEIIEKVIDSSRILIAVGQEELNPALSEVLAKIQEEFNIPVLGDAISNVGFDSISKHDLFLGGDDSLLKPDLLITIGKSFISKSFKTFLRKYKAEEHWHLQYGDHLIDTFQSLTQIIPVSPLDFFSKLFADIDYDNFRNGDMEERDPEFKNIWFERELKARKYVESFFQADFKTESFNEFLVIKQFMEGLPDNSQLHLANSLSVRYANYIGVESKKKIEVFANRGTSGIDGCVSTAVGAAISTKKPVFLLVGDVAFFYDRNALWNRYLPENLRIVLLNNHGGGIFRVIDGPSKLQELEDYFETVQSYNAEKTCQDADIEYVKVNNNEGLMAKLSLFTENSGKPKLLEVDTDSLVNTEIFKKIKAGFKAV